MAQSTSAWLEGVSPDVQSKRYEVAVPASRLGRGSTCDIALMDAMVSRDHAEIRFESGVFTVVDLKSTHGTWVDGQRVAQAVLRDGARLRLGTSEFIVHLPQDAIPTRLIAGEGVTASQDLATAALPPVLQPGPPPPPAPAQSPTAPPDAPSGTRRRRRLVIGCAVAAVIALCGCLALVAIVRWLDARGITTGESDRLGVEAPAPYTQEDLALAMVADLPDERPEILARFGRPDEFEISVVQVEAGEVRTESWRYYALGTQVDFVDGAIVWAVELKPPERQTVFPAWYDPTAFKAGLSLEQASALVQRASPAGTVPEPIDLSPGGDDLAGSVLLAGDQITLGFQDGQLVYVETIGASVGEVGR